MSGLDELLTAAAVARLERASAGSESGGLSVAVVVDDFTWDSFVRATVDFALAVPRGLGDAWRRDFTRTVSLAGRPASVAQRFPGGHRPAGGALAWYGPAPAEELRKMSRMLRAFQGPAPVRAPERPCTVRPSGPDSGHVAEATVATDRVSVAEYLVHVHHLFAEATLRGLIRPGDAIRVAHRPNLDGPLVRAALDPASADTVQTRISHDSSDPTRPRLFAVLTSDRREGRPCKPNAS
jgi:Family of unknown function (DUF6182)